MSEVAVLDRRRSKSALATIWVAAGLVLGGCAATESPTVQPTLALTPYPPWTLTRSPEEISLRWYPDATPAAAAEEAARLHCRAWNKSAVLVSDIRDGSAEIARYRCR